MSKRVKLSAFFLVASVFISFAACQHGPSAVKQPYIDPSSAGKMAMEMYDKNGDGKVSGDEFDHAPGLKAALPRLDTNRDNAVTADEVAERVKVWRRTGAGAMLFSFTVTLDGKPLPGATVTFEPEAFLGDEIKQAVATTDEFGSGGPSIPKKLRIPGNPPGVNLGLYQVKISKIVNGKETIPAKYNRDTILGQEVSRDVPAIANQHVVYALSTK